MPKNDRVDCGEDGETPPAKIDPEVARLVLENERKLVAIREAGRVANILAGGISGWLIAHEIAGKTTTLGISVSLLFVTSLTVAFGAGVGIAWTILNVRVKELGAERERLRARAEAQEALLKQRQPPQIEHKVVDNE